MDEARTTRTRADLIGHQSGIVTHTTAVVAGEQRAEVAAHYVGTEQARVTLTLGFLAMTFTSAAAAQKVLEAFAAARAALMGIDNAAPLPEPDGAQFARNVISLTWIDAPTYAIVRGNRYSDAQRRTIYWADVHMGPVTWRIIDHVGYSSLISALRTAHKTAVAAFPDGAKYRKDPTKVDAER
ncbi:hypothetical protein MWT96_25120 (plasmid) [Prescottella equi]|uniref:Uncharacterized protein n=1 Tax=Rhodococcus hoagii TaxID=43767 RepID=A0A9Q5F214_RHOHA|nr:hypothetical protein [Prescottella equi]AVR64938.1 hypothetical protein pRERM600 [Prescottella equi]MBM4487722.1 hypothetical protein [Prescottella equi]MBM4495131.1 hypothetical protein [Prescottella equi]MBM4498416.1 hypothetical protein [Prescottella equi]MBM4507704.1 hypothetical protein [Prescottella equi]